ncbi:hypothetical protein VTK56DRAFT_10170 [Thermocarpiscus australiensis]
MRLATRHHPERLAHTLHGKPHSVNPTSAAATEAINHNRARILLAHVNASSDEYTVIFTPNATGPAKPPARPTPSTEVRGGGDFAARRRCFCSPGPTAIELRLDANAARRLSKVYSLTRGLDEVIEVLRFPAAGAIRVSFGIASTAADVDKFFSFADKTYKDRFTTSEGLAPREGAEWLVCCP